ncbi:MAG: tetratricopeptide repeat protein, partial [Deltaproteobacteria bacterium]|nr:tetratricopeptide repeat protein [Deltaproteobacteria bacterium]
MWSAHQTARRHTASQPETGAPPPLRRPPLDFIITGATHRVLTQAVITLRVYRRGLPSGKPALWQTKVDLLKQPPRLVVGQALAFAGPIILPPPKTGDGGGQPPGPVSWESTPWPQTWKAVQAFFSLPPPSDGPAGWNRRIQELAPFLKEPGLELHAALDLAALNLALALAEKQPEASRKHLKQALDYATRGADLAPWATRALALKGEAYVLLKEDYPARKEALVARVKNPLDGLAWMVLGLSAGLSTGEGSGYIRQALRVDPFLRGANRPPGQPVFQYGTLEPHWAKWDELNSRNPALIQKQTQTLMAGGQTLFAKKDWDGAAKAFQQAAKLNPDEAAPQIWLGRILLETGRADQAAEALNRLANQPPQNPEALFYLGMARLSQTKYPEAEEAFRSALREIPQPETPLHQQALFQLALSLTLRERWDESVPVLERLTSLNPGHSRGWLHLAVARYHLGRYPEADQAVQHHLELTPDSAEGREWQGRIQGKM